MTKPIGTVEVDGRYYVSMFPDSRGVRTDELQPGTKVLLPGRIVRTVADITETCWENAKGQTILRVGYVEGNTAEWGAANTAAPGTMWKVEVAS